MGAVSIRSLYSPSRIGLRPVYLKNTKDGFIVAKSNKKEMNATEAIKLRQIIVKLNN